MMSLAHRDTAIAPDGQSCTGPLDSHVEGFATELARKGYAKNTVLSKNELLANLSRWLERRCLPLDALDEGRLGQFLADRRRQGKVRRGDPTTGHQLLEYLRDRDAIAAAPQRIDKTPAASLTRDFEEFLCSERGLSPSTVVSYLPVVRRLLDELLGRGALRLEQLRPRELHGFVLHEIQRVSRSHGKGVVTALRSFLRFVLQRGAIQTDLASTLPGVATWRLSHLPKSLPPEQVERLLACCDRTSPTGTRDHAILLLLARLGLRGGEVVAMTLEDLDWERGEIVVRGKGQRLERLPLPADVGAALARYLCEVRPPCTTRRVFIRMQAPQQGLAGPTAVCCIVRRALKRACLDPEFKGAHLLRHSLATDLLRRGASLSEIGQLLRHRQPTTTQIYAKVDIAALRGIAQPWPRGAS
jgi:site-specific recombinase XerD